MGESWITILMMVCFFLLPIIFDQKKKRKSSETEDQTEDGGSDFNELLSELELDLQEEDSEDEIKEVPEIKISSTAAKPHHQEPEVQKDVKAGRGMSKEDKKKLIIYSEVMSPKYKEY